VPCNLTASARIAGAASVFALTVIVVFTAMIPAAPARAAEPSASGTATSTGTTEPARIWSGDIEVGAVFTSGNTDNESIKVRVDAERDVDKWINTFHADTLNASQDGEETANKLYLFYRLDRKLASDRSLFARVAYEEDQFSGFDRQVDGTVGYAQTLLERDNLKITGDVGGGARYTEVTDDGNDTEFLVRVAGKLAWQISDNAKFSQFVGVEAGSDIITTRSETALVANINSTLAMKLALTVKHSSEVPVGKTKTDTETTVTLVYNF